MVESAGGFDSSLKSGGDVKLSKSISSSGGAIVYLSSMIVAHPTRGNVKDILKKQRRVVGGRWQSDTRPAKLFRFFAIFLLELLVRSKRIWSEPIPIRDKVSVFGIAGRVFLVSILEATSLEAGKEPNRS